MPPQRIDQRLETITVTVFACVPDFGVVIVRTVDGFQYALNEETEGVSLLELRRGSG